MILWSLMCSIEFLYMARNLESSFISPTPELGCSPFAYRGAVICQASGLQLANCCSRCSPLPLPVHGLMMIFCHLRGTTSMSRSIKSAVSGAALNARQ